ncbi:MAG: class I SAM-dependent methyltransferase [Caldisericia bacterium]|nr:class I SAM-dependent methyltransferase [Caldisericia bacterium]
MKRKPFKKDKDFLSQVPAWEAAYKESPKLVIDFEKKKWRKAKASFTSHDLQIFGCAVMEDWEAPYMKELAKIASSRGGIVLELGFGMGISASFIQQENIKKHIIIEANHSVAEKARTFAREAPHQTQVLEGFWEDMINMIPDCSLDGILFDTYPLTEKELYQNHFLFFPFAHKKLRKGGVFTYYSDEIEKYGKVHINKLKAAGFDIDKIKGVVIPIDPPSNCEYWKAKTILAPLITK